MELAPTLFGDFEDAGEEGYWELCCNDASLTYVRALQRDAQWRLFRLLVDNELVRTVMIKGWVQEDFVIPPGEGADPLRKGMMTQLGMLQMLEPFRHRNFIKFEINVLGYGGTPYPSQLLGHTELKSLMVKSSGWSAEFFSDVTSNLTKLTYLDVGGAKLGNSTFPASFGKMNGLITLIMTDIDINEDFALPALSGPDLAQPSLLKTYKLDRIPARGNAVLRKIPEEIGSLRSLKDFQLRTVQMAHGTSLPASFANLTGLRELSITFCKGLSGPIPRALSLYHCRCQ